MNKPPLDSADAALWMLAQLDADTKDKVRRRLALRLDPPVSSEAQRKNELRLVVQLLGAVTPARGWTFSYVPRSQYDSRRTPQSPSSAALVERYGSWRNVCRHAHQLLTGQPNRLQKHRRQASSKAPRRHSEQDAIAAIQECAREIDRAPSTIAYRAWRGPAEQRRRGNATYPSTSAILRLYADRGGWIAALENAELIAPPAMTVRVVTSSKQNAIQLVAVARAAGLIAAHAGNRNWIEVRGTLAQTRDEIWNCARAVGATKLTLFEPRTKILQKHDA